eukprot:8883249-Alexandrium_andersonii.AAC.1
MAARHDIDALHEACGVVWTRQAAAACAFAHTCARARTHARAYSRTRTRALHSRTSAPRHTCHGSQFTHLLSWQNQRTTRHWPEPFWAKPVPPTSLCLRSREGPVRS